MAGDVVNIKVCSPLKLCSGLTGNYHALCHYSYNLPLCAMVKKTLKQQITRQKRVTLHLKNNISKYIR